MKTDHILVIRFSAMGDVAMTVPAVYALAKSYPHVRVTVLSRPFARAFFEGLAPNVGFMAADVKGEYRGLHGLNVLYRRLVAKHFTAVADLHDVLRTKYIRLRFNLSAYRVEHIDKHREGKRALCRTKNKVKEQQPTSFDNYFEVFERLGYPVAREFRSLFGEGRGDLSLLPPAIGEKQAGQPWIGIAPFAAHAGKVYPPERMERVIELLAERHPQARLFLFGGGKAEKEQLDAWCQRFPACTNASALLGSLTGELTLMSHLDVMVSMDSANMHLASLVATPVVSVWGATHPFAGFMGWRQREENAVQVELDCRPCSIYGNRPCRRGDFACMTLIQPLTIVERVENVIARGKDNGEKNIP